MPPRPRPPIAPLSPNRYMHIVAPARHQASTGYPRLPSRNYRAMQWKARTLRRAASTQSQSITVAGEPALGDGALIGRSGPPGLSISMCATPASVPWPWTARRGCPFPPFRLRGPQRRVYPAEATSGNSAPPRRRFFCENGSVPRVISKGIFGLCAPRSFGTPERVAVTSKTAGRAVRSFPRVFRHDKSWSEICPAGEPTELARNTALKYLFGLSFV